MDKKISSYIFALIVLSRLTAHSPLTTLHDDNGGVALRESIFEKIPMRSFFDYLQIEFNYNVDWQLPRYSGDPITIDYSKVPEELLNKPIDMSYSTLLLLGLADVLAFEHGLDWTIDGHTLKFISSVESASRPHASVKKWSNDEVGIVINNEDRKFWPEYELPRGVVVLAKTEGRWSTETCTLSLEASSPIELCYQLRPAPKTTAFIFSASGTYYKVVYYFEKSDTGIVIDSRVRMNVKEGERLEGTDV